MAEQSGETGLLTNSQESQPGGASERLDSTRLAFGISAERFGIETETLTSLPGDKNYWEIVWSNLGLKVPGETEEEAQQRVCADIVGALNQLGDDHERSKSFKKFLGLDPGDPLDLDRLVAVTSGKATPEQGARKKQESSRRARQERESEIKSWEEEAQLFWERFWATPENAAATPRFEDTIRARGFEQALRNVAKHYVDREWKSRVSQDDVWEVAGAREIGIRINSLIINLTNPPKSNFIHPLNNVQEWDDFLKSDKINWEVLVREAVGLDANQSPGTISLEQRNKLVAIKRAISKTLHADVRRAGDQDMREYKGKLLTYINAALRDYVDPLLKSR